MAPNPHDSPAGLGEPAIGITITRNIAFDFCAPPLTIIFGPGSVFGAPVPKAAIDEYRDPRSRKGDVDCSPTACQYSTMEAKAKTAAVQFGSEITLARIVSLSRSRHPLRRGGRDGIEEFNISRHASCDV
jgi:hypothetical protein